MTKSGVNVKLGLEATAELIAGEKPDAVVIAAGAIPIVSGDISGVMGKNVMNALDVFAHIEEAGQKVAVIGGGLVGCEIAELLSQKGKKVTIIEMLDEIGSDIGPTNKRAVLHYLQNAGVEMVANAKVQEVTEKGIKAIRNNETEFYEADTVVLAIGFKPDDELTRQLAEEISLLYPIGDCVRSGRIVDAIGDGARIGREL
jgi:pyruvate/2-oxoglutarate dehydrogenase complex dihydrolipoamide dehydrogenase (E3) component